MWRGEAPILLRPETVALMGQNQIREVNAGILKTAMPQRSNDVDFFPGIPCKWGLGYMINTHPGPNGRSVTRRSFIGVKIAALLKPDCRCVSRAGLPSALGQHRS
jgi:hypothetical protein